MKIFPLRHARQIFKQLLKRYRRSKTQLSERQRKEMAKALNQLQSEILSKNRKQALEVSKEASKLADQTMKQNPFRRFCYFLINLTLALIVALLIRTIWFELYEIPTGSMRPTLSEGDRLTVSKTAFGINIPLSPGHFYFNPDLVLRNGTFVFTGSGMDIQNANTLYFYLFPGKKQFVKRLIGKPGDRLYFYGGKIYGLDANGNDISPLLNPSSLQTIDHIPFIYLSGKVSLPKKPTGGIYSPVTLKQMNLPLAELSVESQKVVASLLPPFASEVSDYYELWGMNDYAAARLLTPEELHAFDQVASSRLKSAPLYLHIFHHPSIKQPKITRDPLGRFVPSLGLSSSFLPLSEEHLKELMHHLYTARFIVEKGKAHRYGEKLSSASPSLVGVPDGTYEFYHGKGYLVGRGNILRPLPKDHPLLDQSPQRIQLLYNLGIEWLDYFAPYAKEQPLLPARYVYYRDGELWTMGGMLLKQDDPSLLEFTESELFRSQTAPEARPYIPFLDPGPPLSSDGSLSRTLIEKKGLTIPASHYMALGDNYAMSADSRDFGFVPESNLRGAPDFIFYPPGPRFGPLPQAAYPYFNGPRSFIWILAALGFGGYYIWHRKKYHLPQKIE